SSRSAQIARVLNNLGCAAFVVHVACAFQFYHHWSHAAAYADTARQTKDYFGLDWGGGLYLNYVFLVVWVGQAIRSWIVGPDSPRKTDFVFWGLRVDRKSTRLNSSHVKISYAVF